jgi:hypothetical protein
MRFLILLLPILLTACGDDPLIDEAKEKVKVRLVDPRAARFSEVRKCVHSVMVEGRVNARNAYGVYDGDRQFYAWKGRVVLSQNEFQDAGNAFQHEAGNCNGTDKAHRDLSEPPRFPFPPPSLSWPP